MGQITELRSPIYKMKIIISPLIISLLLSELTNDKGSDQRLVQSPQYILTTFKNNCYY